MYRKLRVFVNSIFFKEQGDSTSDRKCILGDRLVFLVKKLRSSISGFEEIIKIGIALCILHFCYQGYSKVVGFIDREKKIKELRTAIRNLSKEEVVMRAKFLGASTNGLKRIRVSQSYTCTNSYINARGWKKTIEIEGDIIYFDSLIVNFSLSEIADGEISNIALPYRIFSDKVSAEKGTLLLDASVKYSGDGFGGLPKDQYKELLKLFTNRKYAQSLGVRCANGSAQGKLFKEGEEVTLMVYSVGGMGIE